MFDAEDHTFSPDNPSRLVPDPIATIDDLKTHLSRPDLVVLDSRPEGDYARGHIVGAISFPTYTADIKPRDSRPETMSQFVANLSGRLRAAGITRAHQVIWYDDMSGAYAARGVWLLDFAGVPGSTMLDGGYAAWVESGGIVERVPRTLPASSLGLSPNWEVFAPAWFVEQIASGERRGTIIDTRADNEWDAGTVPDACHFDWTLGLQSNGTFIGRQDMLERLAQAGIDPMSSDPLVTFCGSGYRAAHVYLVLRWLGATDVRNYSPSWHEWDAEPTLPVVIPDERAGSTA